MNKVMLAAISNIFVIQGDFFNGTIRFDMVYHKFWKIIRWWRHMNITTWVTGITARTWLMNSCNILQRRGAWEFDEAEGQSRLQYCGHPSTDVYCIYAMMMTRGRQVVPVKCTPSSSCEMYTMTFPAQQMPSVHSLHHDRAGVFVNCPHRSRTKIERYISHWWICESKWLEWTILLH